jgi:hypothetical protein
MFYSRNRRESIYGILVRRLGAIRKLKRKDNDNASQVTLTQVLTVMGQSSLDEANWPLYGSSLHKLSGATHTK